MYAYGVSGVYGGGWFFRGELLGKVAVAKVGRDVQAHARLKNGQLFYFTQGMCKPLCFSFNCFQ